jgi:acyl-CoA oxidase
LDQQVVRAALKSLKGLSSADKLTPSSLYLRLLLPGSQLASVSPTEEEWRDPLTAINLLEWRAALLVKELGSNLKDPDASVVQRVSKAITEAFVARQVGEMIKQCASKSTGTGTQRTSDVLVQVFLLYLLTTVEGSVADLLSFGALKASRGGGDATRPLRLAVHRTCRAILPEAIGLSDAFGFTDWELDR